MFLILLPDQPFACCLKNVAETFKRHIIEYSIPFIPILSPFKSKRIRQNVICVCLFLIVKCTFLKRQAQAYSKAKSCQLSHLNSLGDQLRKIKSLLPHNFLIHLTSASVSALLIISITKRNRNKLQTPKHIYNHIAPILDQCMSVH